MTSNYIQKVAIVGASGNIGTYITEELLKTGKHTVTAITREDSQGTVPAGVHVKKVDYNNHSSIVDALRGQDALIITMSVNAPRDQQAKIISAAADANVPWVLPNDWGADGRDEALSADVPSFGAKQLALQQISELGKSSYLAVVTGFWYQWSLAIPPAYGFDFANRTVTFFDEGEQKISTSTFQQVGRAVAALLSLPIHPEDGNTERSLDHLRNNLVYVASFTVSQRDMFASALRVTGTKESDWTITKESSTERYTKGKADMMAGDRMGFVKMMYTRVFYPDECGNYEKNRGLHNQLLGLTEEDLDEATKLAVDRSKEVAAVFARYGGGDPHSRGSS